MANYCINEKKSKNCRFVYKGIVIGTEKQLCNILSDEKPCSTECVCTEKCICEYENNE